MNTPWGCWNCGNKVYGPVCFNCDPKPKSAMPSSLYITHVKAKICQKCGKEQDKLVCNNCLSNPTK